MIDGTATESYFKGVEYNGYLIKLTRDHYLYEVHTLNGKPTPRVLTSKFTGIERTKRAIDDYNENKKVNETTSTS
ncbi:hypothetical protein ABIF29_006417 [Bradyrhizobium elkanii]|uniref:Uncharacterized protein n=1 Tax=Bradyrhizobium elkanii TaxID=29448 RepID=A0ABV4F827_BRAEL|nr:hypothetical protein [Bradyrhizobium elkanii]MCP1976959.1 hypothetical protein [Bradyrhizobium elkanii]MCS3888523.1 hypothetical protein [Bradyrhizobium elkanii]MCS4212455.1 hypothetical protein [Bradyrhizobium elkanii]MCW2191910.1 hypothetical protein [Bradyrhizobium elkanii]